MTLADWQSGLAAVAVYVDGRHAPELDAHGQPLVDADVLILVNGSPEPVRFTLPEVSQRRSWHAELDSYDLGVPAADPAGQPRAAGGRPARGRG